LLEEDQGTMDWVFEVIWTEIRDVLLVA